MGLGTEVVQDISMLAHCVEIFVMSGQCLSGSDYSPRFRVNFSYILPASQTTPLFNHRPSLDATKHYTHLGQRAVRVLYNAHLKVGVYFAGSKVLPF